MRCAAIVAIMAVSLTGCGGATTHAAAHSVAPSAGLTTAASPSTDITALDTQAKIACTYVDKALPFKDWAAEGALNGTAGMVKSQQDGQTFIHDYGAAAVAALKSTTPGFSDYARTLAGGSATTGAAITDYFIRTGSTRVVEFRSFCESHGWVGNP